MEQGQLAALAAGGYQALEVEERGSPVALAVREQPAVEVEVLGPQVEAAERGPPAEAAARGQPVEAAEVQPKP